MSDEKETLEEKVCPDCKKEISAEDMPDHECKSKEDTNEIEIQDGQTEISESDETEQARCEVEEEITFIGESQNSDIVEDVRILEGDPEGKEWKVVLIAPGVSKNKTYYSPSMLSKKTDLFEGAPCFADHDSDNPTSRSVKEVLGWYDNVKYENGVGITAKFHSLKSQAWFSEMLKEAYTRGKPDLLGFSINGVGSKRLGKVNGETVSVIEDLHKIDSVDAVINPSAGGRVMRLIANVTGEKEDLELLDKMTKDELKETRSDLYDEIVNEAIVAEQEKIKELEAKMAEMNDKTEAEKTQIEENTNNEKQAELARLEEEAKARLTKIDEMTAEAEKRVRVAECKATLSSVLAESELPNPVKKKIERKYMGQIFDVADLEATITEEKEVLESLLEDESVPYTRTNNPEIKVGDSQRDRAVKALDGFWDNKAVDGVPPARTLMEAYAQFTGKNSWDVSPDMFLAESNSKNYDSNRRISESGDRSHRLSESLSAGNWAEVLGDSITRRMVKDYNDLGYDEWRKLVEVNSISDFRTQRRTRFGGYGLLPSVTELQPYAVDTSPTDEEATYSISKRGRLEKLTLEMIAKDDVGSIRRLPTKLARAAKITLYRFVFDMISLSSTESATTYDSSKLFTVAHANTVLATTAVVSTPDAALNDAFLTLGKQRMAKQAAYNESTHILGLRPKYLITTIDNEEIAKRILGNDVVYNASQAAWSDVNTHKGSLELITVPYWNDDDDGRADRWVLAADPMDIPTIEVGFFQGRQAPDLFTQDMENVGTMFNTDELTYKIRHIYGGTILDHRGFIGSCVFA